MLIVRPHRPHQLALMSLLPQKHLNQSRPHPRTLPIQCWPTSRLSSAHFPADSCGMPSSSYWVPYAPIGLSANFDGIWKWLRCVLDKSCWLHLRHEACWIFFLQGSGSEMIWSFKLRGELAALGMFRISMQTNETTREERSKDISTCKRLCWSHRIDKGRRSFLWHHNRGGWDINGHLTVLEHCMKECLSFASNLHPFFFRDTLISLCRSSWMRQAYAKPGIRWVLWQLFPNLLSGIAVHTRSDELTRSVKQP